jgi:putative intracellular protease/amidase
MRVIGRMVQQKKVVGAIGSGIINLGRNGFLERAEVSSYHGHASLVEKMKVGKWIAEPKVIVNLPFVTSSEVSHSRELAEEVLKAIPDHPLK